MDKLITLQNDKRTVFVGDIHGDYESLQRVIQKYSCQFDGTTRFVFLGDYIDRGDDSLKVVEYLFDLKKKHGDLVYLLQGNHEGDGIVSCDGDFWLNPQSELGNYREKFLELPLAVELGGIIATHGALPVLNSVQDFNLIKTDLNPWHKRWYEFADKKYIQTVWGDFGKSDSYYFGKLEDDDTGIIKSIRPQYSEVYLDKALGAIGKKILIRAHQPIVDPILFNGKLFTIISTDYFRKVYGDPLVAIVEAGADTENHFSVRLETFDNPNISKLSGMTGAGKK